MLTVYENAFYFALFNNFSGNGHKFNCKLALETCATIPPNINVDAYFNLGEINAYFQILFTPKFKFLKLHSKVGSFERLFKFNQVHLGLHRHN